MRTITGIASGIEKTVIGKVTRLPQPIYCRKDYVLIVNGKHNEASLWGYAAVLFSGEVPGCATRQVSNINPADLDSLHNDDVIQIEPTGQITVVWSTEAKDNCILVSKSCNCNCIMCPQPGEKDDASGHQRNLKIIRLAATQAPVSIGLTGGEPTLRFENLVDIIRACQKYLPNATISLLTNGVLLSKSELVKQIVDLQHPSLVFEIPLYSDIEAIHDSILRMPGGFNRTIAGLQNLAKMLQRIGIRVVVQKANYSRLPAQAEFIYRNLPFVSHVAFMGLEITGAASTHLDEIWVDPMEYSTQLQEGVHHLHQRDIDVSIYNLPLCLLSECLWKFSRDSISGWKKTFLSICDSCDVKEKCSGVFSTSSYQSKNIRSVHRVSLFSTENSTHNSNRN